MDLGAIFRFPNWKTLTTVSKPNFSSSVWRDIAFAFGSHLEIWILHCTSHTCHGHVTWLQRRYYPPFNQNNLWQLVHNSNDHGFTRDYPTPQPSEFAQCVSQYQKGGGSKRFINGGKLSSEEMTVFHSMCNSQVWHLCTDVGTAAHTANLGYLAFLF